MKKSVILLLITILFGCVTTESVPETHYYLLEDKPLVMQWEEGNQSVSVEIVAIPAYLQQKNIVMLEQSHKLYIANYHQWAVDLDTMLKNVLVFDLNQQTDATNFVDTCRDCEKLKLYLDSFYPTFDGNIVLTGYFKFSKANVTSTGHTFEIQVRQATKGYLSSVQAMRKAISELAKEILKQKR
ncbi:PqiC family protein [Glaciecola sp. 1036]|uniref:PqiC family protein n=1 Tax=Alteromonadaceae TaxID=72275 RepID=UPI003CFEE660